MKAAWRRCVSALSFVSLILQPSQFASAASCPKVAVGSFPDASMLRAMDCVNPASISGVPLSAGKIEFSDLAQISSKGASKSKTAHEAKALFSVGAGTMTLGASSCSLSAVGLSKTADLSVQMRLDFDACSLGPKTASVLLNVEKATGDFLAKEKSIVPFFKHVFEKETATPEPSVAKVVLNFGETFVGNGQCDVPDILKTWEGIADVRSCKMLCIADIQRIFATGGDAGLKADLKKCTGYAVSTAGKGCHLYQGTSPKAIIKKDPDFSCFNLTSSETTYEESTPAPPTAEEVEAQEAKLPRLNLNFAEDAKSASVLTFNSPNATGCFAPFNQITLEDSAFSMISTKVSAAEMDELLLMLPDPEARRLEEAATAQVSAVQADRVTFAGAALAAPAAAGAVGLGALAPSTTAEPKCTPVPRATANTLPVTIINLLLVGGAVAAGYFGFTTGKAQSAPAGYAPVK